MAMHKISEVHDLRKILEELLDRLERGKIIADAQSIMNKGSPNYGKMNY
jgi:AmiR/NasT family two-component response regulator